MTDDRTPTSVGSPWFEDLHRGQVFDDAPAVTLTDAHMAFHQAAYGDRLRIALDHTLAKRVTGSDRALVHPNVVCNVAIGQTTFPSGRVLGNLFYRGLVMDAPVHVGDTLRTTTRIVALRQNRPKPGRAATGLAVFEVDVVNQHGDRVLRFWRCPMLPCRDPEAETGHADDLDAIAADLDEDRVHGAVPTTWDLGAFRSTVPGAHFDDVEAGARFAIEGRDTVTIAPEITRLTLNVAAAHLDAGAGGRGRRLVYGGHTISMAAAQALRALPNLLTLIAWRRCDHTGPVYEGDVLRSTVDVDGMTPLAGGGGLVDLHVVTHAERAPDGPDAGREDAVLDWRLVALMA